MQATSVRHTIVVDRSGTGAALEPDEISYRTLVSAQSADCPCAALEANDPAFLIFTSGTEARPKGLVHSVAGFLVGAWANVQWQVGLTDDDVYWCTADIGWLTFPIQAVIGGLAHGATLLCYEGSLDYPAPSRFYEIAARHGVTNPSYARQLRILSDGCSGNPRFIG